MPCAQATLGGGKRASGWCTAARGKALVLSRARGLGPECGVASANARAGPVVPPHASRRSKQSRDGLWRTELRVQYRDPRLLLDAPASTVDRAERRLRRCCRRTALTARAGQSRTPSRLRGER
jgi:hypothetical protein